MRCAASENCCVRPRCPPPTRNVIRLADPQHPLNLFLIGAGGDEIVKGLFGDANEMVLYESGPLASAVLGMFEAAFPFEHCPAVVVILRHLREDGAEVT